MKKLRILPAALAAAILLSVRVLAAPSAELVRVFETEGVLYTYVSITGSDSPITKAEAKLGQQSFPASGPLETVRQAGFPVEYLLLVDNSNSMPPFREEAAAFVRTLTEANGEDTSFSLASFGDAFTLLGEDLGAEALIAGMDDIPMDETVTRLNTSIGQALDYFETVPRTGNQLRCLVVLSDAVQYDPQGGIPYEELAQRLSRSDVMLHSVGLGGDDAALERLSGLALASGGSHQNVSGTESAAAAAQSLARSCGDLLVTGFDISTYRPVGGEEPVSVTFASGGELVCRGQGTVELFPAEEEAQPAPAGPEETPQVPPAGQTQSAPSGGEPVGEPADDPPILPIAAGAAAIAAVLAVLLVRLRRKKAPTAPPARKEAPQTAPAAGIYMRMEVSGGVLKTDRTEFLLSAELLMGTDPSCDAVFDDEGISWKIRVFLDQGAVCAEDLSPETEMRVNGVPISAPVRLRSGDEIAAGGVAFRLKF